MTSRSKRLPPDFKVTDDHREYAARKGWPLYMPDQFISEFRLYFEAKGTKWKNWDQCFKLWMWREFKAKTWKWDKYEVAAKEQERQQYRRTTETYITQDKAGYAERVTRPTPMPESVRAIVERMRKG